MDETAERPEAAEPAGQHIDLLVLACPAQCIEHSLDAFIVAVDERIIENDRGGCAAFHKHSAHGQANEHGNLLLRAVREAIERFGSFPLDAG